MAAVHLRPSSSSIIACPWVLSRSTGVVVVWERSIITAAFASSFVDPINRRQLVAAC